MATNLKNLAEDDLKEILEKHKLWLKGKPEGEQANLSKVNLLGADLSHALLDKAILHGSDLRGANLYNARLRDADMRRTRLENAFLRKADLQGANLMKAIAPKANFREAIMLSTNLRKADLYKANLTQTALSGNYLYNTKLTGANLTKTRLTGCIGNMKEVKSLQIERWPVVYTSTRLYIGCECAKIEEWKNFKEETIYLMDEGALELWEKWKPTIFHIIEMSPATPTGHEEK